MIIQAQHSIWGHIYIWNTYTEIHIREAKPKLRWLVLATFSVNIYCCENEKPWGPIKHWILKYKCESTKRMDNLNIATFIKFTLSVYRNLLAWTTHSKQAYNTRIACNICYKVQAWWWSKTTTTPSIYIFLSYNLYLMRVFLM